MLFRYFGTNPPTFLGEVVRSSEMRPLAFLDYFGTNRHTFLGKGAISGETSPSVLF